MNSESTRDEPVGRFAVREVAHVLEHLETAVRQGAVCGAGVLDGNDRIAATPDDERRDPAHDVETIVRAHLLATEVDHRSQRADERGTRCGIHERLVAAPHLGGVWAPLEPDPPQPAGDRIADLARGGSEQEREEILDAGKRQSRGAVARRRVPSPPEPTSTSRSQCSGY